MSWSGYIPARIQCVKSPCPAGCVDISVTAFGPKKYYLGSGDCRAPALDKCCLRINRQQGKKE